MISVFGTYSSMLAAGLIEEVKGLLQTSGIEDSKPMQSIGYRQVKDYLLGNISV